MNIDNNEIRTAVDEIKSYVHQEMDRIEQRLSVGSDALAFLDTALANYRRTNRKNLVVPYRFLSKFTADLDIRFPHRKILECLAMRFDYERSRFKEVRISRLVKDARVSKGAINAYLEPLIKRNIVSKRREGRSVWLSIAEEYANDTRG